MWMNRLRVLLVLLSACARSTSAPPDSGSTPTNWWTDTSTPPPGHAARLDLSGGAHWEAEPWGDGGSALTYHLPEWAPPRDFSPIYLDAHGCCVAVPDPMYPAVGMRCLRGHECGLLDGEP
jgi:hypothetical protein